MYKYDCPLIPCIWKWTSLEFGLGFFFASAGGRDSNPRPSDLQADAMTIRPRRLPSVSPKRVSMSRTGRQNFAWLSGVGSQTWRQNLVWPPPFVVLSTFEEDFEAILDHPLFHFEGASRFKIEVGQVFQIPQERDTFSQLNIWRRLWSNVCMYVKIYCLAHLSISDKSFKIKQI